MDEAEKIKIIAEHYGYDSQSRQCIEEMGELTQAINKFWRKQLGCGNRELPNDPEEIPMFTKEYDNLIEEMADVQVMLLQMAYLLKTDIQSMADIKLNRQLERIKREWLNLNN
jgi:NTP pyrophosphatase (non-canonical NTP hydrolase)